MLRTVGHLRLHQVVHRGRLRAQRKLLGAFPDAAERLLRQRVGTVRGWPIDFVPLDRMRTDWPDAAMLRAGKVELLGQVGELSDWRAADAPQLWRFHLHYWDWAWGFTGSEADRAAFGALFAQWKEQTRFGRWDEWAPYVAALRAWSWCGQYRALVSGAAWEPEFQEQLALHLGFVRRHLERDVGGNHLIKNLKAMAGLAVFFNRQDLLRAALERLRRELATQVLPDGGHFERSPAYHCQVLGDLVDLAGLLGSDAPAWLLDAVEAMRRWLGCVLLPDGSVPLLNDGFPVDRGVVSLLQPGPPAPEGLTHLVDSGLVVMREGDAHVLADVGLPCPDELPAHAHADTLGFLLHVGDRRLVSEAGTSTYTAGAVRGFERSTAAHSTVEVDGCSSTEVWGAFRAGRRARPTVHAASSDGGLRLVASHDGFRHLKGSPVHRRTWLLTQDSLVVEDEVMGEGEHDVCLRFHGAQQDELSSSVALESEAVAHARGWEDRVQGHVLVHRSRTRLPWRAVSTFNRE